MARMNVILFAAGSYNPPTHMHLRMFEIARDFLHQSGRFQVLGGIVSPVHDDYEKESLSEASAFHRSSMAKLSLKANPFVKLSTYETEQSTWTRLRVVLEEHKRLLLDTADDLRLPWAPERFDPKEAFQILFLCGADLLESFSVPGLWLEEDIEAIVKDFGLVVISREGSNPQKFIYNSDMLTKYKSNIHIVTEWITNDISSTKVRRSIRRKESVKYLIPDEVIQYISEHGLYGSRKNEYSSSRPIDSSPLINSASCLIRPEEVSSFSASSSSCEMMACDAAADNLSNKVDFFYEETTQIPPATTMDSTPSSSPSSVQSQLSLIKSSSSPVLEELRDEAVMPSEDEMSPLEFNASDLAPIQECLVSEEVAYHSEALQEALILDEKKALEEETEGWVQEESAEFHIIGEDIVVGQAFVQEEEEVLLVRGEEVVENSSCLPVIEECPKIPPASPDATDSLSTDEVDKTVIERTLFSKDSVDFSDMPPPPLPYSESPDPATKPSSMEEYVLVDNDKVEQQQPEDLEEEFLPPDPPLVVISTPKSDKHTPSKKKSEDKVQIEITKKGIIVISEKESFL